ncbi:hypothetical protein L7F22_016144 [Adiantum nelumboides]|nr:hypothetical protein [Adiantum nelumboides]
MGTVGDPLNVYLFPTRHEPESLKLDKFLGTDVDGAATIIQGLLLSRTTLVAQPAHARPSHASTINCDAPRRALSRPLATELARSAANKIGILIANLAQLVVQHPTKVWRAASGAANLVVGTTKASFDVHQRDGEQTNGHPHPLALDAAKSTQNVIAVGALHPVE